jgi:hypothetical protein
VADVVEIENIANRLHELRVVLPHLIQINLHHLLKHFVLEKVINQLNRHSMLL